jgi:hypothetical protein
MRRTVVGVIAVVTASAFFSLAGLGIAGAVPLSPQNPPAAGAGFSTQSEAATIRDLHDALETAWKAKNADSMRSTSATLNGELAKLRSPQAASVMGADATNAVTKAQSENTALAAQLASLPRGKSAGDLPLPGLGSLTSLVQSLLATLLSLITGLLGGLPVPVPVPSVPVPTPSLPVPAPPAGH